MLRHAVSMVAGLAVLAAAAAVSAPAGPRDEWTIFTDPSGDAKGAIDVTKVALRKSESEGTFTIEITASKSTAALLAAPAATPPPSPTITTDFVSVGLDVDRNAATGASASGFDYSFTRHGASWEAHVLNGATIQPAPFTPVTSFNGYGIYAWTINRSDIGNPTSVAFRVSTSAIVSTRTSTTSLGPDLAPDSGTWTYDLVPAAPSPSPTTTPPAAALRPIIGAPVVTPAQPVAGKPLRVDFRVIRSDTGRPLTSGHMVCDPSIGGTILRHAESFTGGTARLSFTLPRASRGKQLRIKVSIQLATQTATRVTMLRIH